MWDQGVFTDGSGRTAAKRFPNKVSAYLPVAGRILDFSLISGPASRSLAKALAFSLLVGLLVH